MNLPHYNDYVFVETPIEEPFSFSLNWFLLVEFFSLVVNFTQSSF